MTVEKNSILKQTSTLFLAPMAGFSDVTFRGLCRKYGADVMVSEFVMANAVMEAGPHSRIREILSFPPEQRPVGLQIFGAEPALMAAAAQRIEETLKPDFIDINMGCPAPKIVCQNAGSALLKDVPLAVQIVKSVRKTLKSTPLTAKIRIGWDSHHIIAMEVAQKLCDAGIEMLTVHGRTREQGYSGDADWDLIASIAAELPIPVIGNGSVNGGYDAEIIRKSGVAGVMIGRAALGNPWIFSRLRADLEGRPHTSEPTAEERMQTMLDYARELIENHGETLASIRPRLKPFTSNLPGARKIRKAMDSIQSYEELQRRIQEQLRDGSCMI